MKKRLLRLSLVSVVVVALVASLLAFVGCGGKKDNANLKRPDEVFAVAGVSTGAMLSDMKASGVAMSDEGALTLDETVIAELNEYMAVVDSLINNNPDASETVESDRPDYAKVQIMKVPDMNGAWTTYKLYYNEDKPSDVAMSDEEGEQSEEESEFESHITGVMVIGENEFPVKGDIEVEQSADEFEQSIEFKAYLDDSKKNYIEFSVENETETEDEGTENEIEYSYKVYENGKKVNSFKLELEEEQGEVEYSIKTKDASGAETKFKLKKEAKGDDTKINVTYTKNGQKGKFSVESSVNAEGKTVYTYTMADGHKVDKVED